MELGRIAGTRLVQLDKSVLTDSVPDKVYHISIDTKGAYWVDDMVERLVAELYDKFKAKVIWIRIENNVIDMQLVGSPFAWVALIAFLPALLSIFGIVAVLISIYSVLSAIPGWAWGLAAVGVGLILIGPTLGKSLSGTYKQVRVYPSVKGR